ncbi:unnamed protein product [Mycena citricolor]|uniref:Uncharacterized protein n=1 Tax=Mycena citricolor TaxID=2018698 RepID=A0AAD2H912_9AGAR|nr:unnamed protein product [Mycena citricolor]
MIDRRHQHDRADDSRRKKHGVFSGYFMPPEYFQHVAMAVCPPSAATMYGPFFSYLLAFDGWRHSLPVEDKKRVPYAQVVNPPPLYAVPTPSDLPEGIFFHTRAVTFESDDQLLDRVTHAALWTESPKDLLRRDEIIETVSRWSGFFIDPGQIRFGCIKDLLPMYDPQDGTIGW